MSATRYRLTVYRKTSIGAYASDPEFPDLPTVSQDAFDLMAWQDRLMTEPRATWYGKAFDVTTQLGEAFVAGKQDAAMELVPLLQWCRQHTSHGDVAELLPAPSAPEPPLCPRCGGANREHYVDTASPGRPVRCVRSESPEAAEAALAHESAYSNYLADRDA